MPFTGIANQEELSILREFHHSVCKDCGIEPASAEGEVAALMVLSLFNCGARTRDALKSGLAALNLREERLSA